MNTEPVAYVDKIWIERPDLVMSQQLDIGRLFMRSGKEIKNYIPLYTHPHPDNLGLAESIIKQQKLEIDALHNLVKEQDKKIIDLAFEKVYAEKSAEVLSELYTHPVKEQDTDCQYCKQGCIRCDARKQLTDEEINVVAILQNAEIVPVGHEIWKTGEEFNKYKRIVLATAKALRKAQEK